MPLKSCCQKCHEPLFNCCCPDNPVMGGHDWFWSFMNHAAEWGMYYARLYGWHERKEKVVAMFCENPKCGAKCETTRRLQDPRRGHGDEIAYVRRYCCSEECMYACIEILAQQAQIVRLVHNDKPS